MTHALNCKIGGLIKRGHNHHREHCEAFAKLACNRVGVEPILREANPTKNTPALYADFMVNDISETERAEV